MKKVTPKTYLPELFLNKLNGDFSQKAVLRALEKCNDEMLQRLGSYQCARELIEYCFNTYSEQRIIPKQLKQEFMDFWDVYGEFDEMLSLYHEAHP